jgi:hypothetical protein
MSDPAFYMTSIEAYAWDDLAKVRCCRHAKGFRSYECEKLLHFLQVDPPLSGRALGLDSHELGFAVLAARELDGMLYQIKQWPVCARILDAVSDRAQLPDDFQYGRANPKPIVDLYETESAANEIWMSKLLGIKIVGDQDGPAERRLKARLVEALSDYPAGCRVYLARMFCNSPYCMGIALCVRSNLQSGDIAPPEATNGPSDGVAIDDLRSYAVFRPDLVAGGRIAEVARIMQRNGQLFIRDILFLDAQQEARLASVCNVLVEKAAGQ